MPQALVAILKPVSLARTHVIMIFKRLHVFLKVKCTYNHMYAVQPREVVYMQFSYSVRIDNRITSHV